MFIPVIFSYNKEFRPNGRRKTAVCKACGERAEQMEYEISGTFRLFFLPVWSGSSSRFVVCKNCGNRLNGSLEMHYK